mmetsp:Transcript_12107/g.28260  ORF Transcript_12107/g.28260 Transcript_12107/m.28260 type:complete len:220 (-) Transcript_12107:236-895(-)
MGNVESLACRPRYSQPFVIPPQTAAEAEAEAEAAANAEAERRAAEQSAAEQAARDEFLSHRARASSQLAPAEVIYRRETGHDMYGGAYAGVHDVLTLLPHTNAFRYHVFRWSVEQQTSQRHEMYTGSFHLKSKGAFHLGLCCPPSGWELLLTPETFYKSPELVTPSDKWGKPGRYVPPPVAWDDQADFTQLLSGAMADWEGANSTLDAQGVELGGHRLN